MSRSMSTTSGVRRAHCVTASAPSAATPTSSMSSSAEISRPRPSRITPWSSASRTRIIAPAAPARRSFPAPGAERTASVPPACATIPSSSVSPSGPPRRAARALGREARAVVARRRAASRPAPARDRHAHGCRPAVPARCGSPRARRGRRARRRRRRRRRLLDLQRRRDARRLQRAEQVAERDLQPGRLEVRRMDLDEQRAQVAHALAQRPVASRSTPAASLVAAPLGVGGQRREAEGDAGEILHDAVVQVGGDPPALLRGRLDGAREQRLALAVAALQAPRHRPRERHLEEHEHDQPADQRRREHAEQPLAAGVDRAEALVDLEQQLACRPACGSSCAPPAACPAGARSGSRARRGR